MEAPVSPCAYNKSKILFLIKYDKLHFKLHFFKSLSPTFWMLFFDTNSFLIHKELNDDIKKLEENKKAYLEEIMNDKIFIDKMKDSAEIEKFAREQYYIKKESSINILLSFIICKKATV